MRRVTFKGIGRAAKTVGSDLEDVAKKAGKKVSDSVEGLVPPVVKDSVEKARGFVKEKTKSAEAKAKGKNVTVSERKDGRYHKIKDITYEDAKGKPKIGERSLDKSQIAKDVAAGTVVAGAGAGAVAAMSDDEQEDMVAQIKRKMREGKELTQSEKRLLRLMEA